MIYQRYVDACVRARQPEHDESHLDGDIIMNFHDFVTLRVTGHAVAGIEVDCELFQPIRRQDCSRRYNNSRCNEMYGFNNVSCC